VFEEGLGSPSQESLFGCVLMEPFDVFFSVPLTAIAVECRPLPSTIAVNSCPSLSIAVDNRQSTAMDGDGRHLTQQWT